jgi:hypothetical protein
VLYGAESAALQREDAQIGRETTVGSGIAIIIPLFDPRRKAKDLFLRPDLRSEIPARAAAVKVEAKPSRVCPP